MELTGIVNGKIKGNLYELDYPQHFRHVKEQALPADNYTLLYEHGERVQPAGQYLDGNPDPQLGKFDALKRSLMTRKHCIFSCGRKSAAMTA